MIEERQKRKEGRVLQEKSLRTVLKVQPTEAYKNLQRFSNDRSRKRPKKTCPTDEA